MIAQHEYKYHCLAHLELLMFFVNFTSVFEKYIALLKETNRFHVSCLLIKLLYVRGFTCE